MFTNQLSKSGNLTVAFVDDNNKSKDKKSDAVASSSSSSSDERSKTKAKWGEALVSEKQKGKVRIIINFIFYTTPYIIYIYFSEHVLTIYLTYLHITFVFILFFHLCKYHH